jgi:glycolate oxidase
MRNNSLIREMEKILESDKVISDDIEKRLYSYDSSFLSIRSEYLPDVVVIPNSTQQVSQIMTYAYKNNIPVTPRGAGSGETCGCLAYKGGIVIDLSSWDTIEEIDPQNMQTVIRPGLVHSKLNQQLLKHGLFFPPDPGSSKMCTLGGMVANNSSGMRAVKYGVTEQYVLGLEVVLPSGEIITTGGKNCKALKNASGININKLFVGSEGILGVITKIRLKVCPIPKSRGIALASFNSLEKTPAAVLAVFKAGILPSAIEVLDHSAIEAINNYQPENSFPPAEAILLFEVDGNPASVSWEGNQIISIMEEFGAKTEWSTESKRMASLWQGRSIVAAAAARLKAQGTRVFAGEDICVPLNKMAEAQKAIRGLGQKYGISVVTYGHIGDGNIHTALIINPEDREEVARLDQMVDSIHQLAIALEGTTTGEHGVGLVRSKYSESEHGNALDTMKKIKATLDPKGLMNPGKIF